MKKTIKSKPANQPKKTTTKIEVWGYAVEIQFRTITAEMADELTVTGVSDARCGEIIGDCDRFETFAFGLADGQLVVDGEIVEDLLPPGKRPQIDRWETLESDKHCLVVTDVWKGTLLELTTDKPFDRSLLSMEAVAYELPDETSSMLVDVKYDGEGWDRNMRLRDEDIAVFYPNGQRREVIVAEG
jgi:hypothetical protein